MKRRDPTTEELDLWRRAMRNTAPLPGRGAETERAETSQTPPSRRAATPRPSSRDKETTGRDRTANPPPPVPAPAPGGLDAATQRRLRRGRMEVEGRIDLHGMRQSEALGVLARFLAQSQAAGRRCVLVITGKGGRLADNGDAEFMRRPEDGVLRRQVPLWLAQEPNRSRVFAVEQAHPRHGGSGAFYVFLRKAQGRP